MDEGRKRTIAIVAGVLMARHLLTVSDLYDDNDSHVTDRMIAASVQIAERIMQKIDVVYSAPKS